MAGSKNCSEARPKRSSPQWLTKKTVKRAKAATASAMVNAAKAVVTADARVAEMVAAANAQKTPKACKAKPAHHVKADAVAKAATKCVMAKAALHVASALSAQRVSVNPVKVVENAVTTTAMKHLPSWPQTAPNAHPALIVVNAAKAAVNAVKAAVTAAASAVTTTKPRAS